ncbi:MAG: hypothetical protein ABR612_09195 [Chromatocurvus sp.]
MDDVVTLGRVIRQHVEDADLETAGQLAAERHRQLLALFDHANVQDNLEANFEGNFEGNLEASDEDNVEGSEESNVETSGETSIETSDAANVKASDQTNNEAMAQWLREILEEDQSLMAALAELRSRMELQLGDSRRSLRNARAYASVAENHGR